MRRVVWRLVRLGLLIAPVVALVMLFEAAPRVGPTPPPDAGDVARAKALYLAARAVTERDGPGRELAIAPGDLDAALAIGARVLPEFRGRGRIGPDGIAVDVSFRLPRADWAGWVNIHARVPPSETGIRIADLQIGPYALPGGLVVPVGRRLANLVLGDGAGDSAAGAVTAVRIEGGAARLAIGLGAGERRRLGARVGDGIRTAMLDSRPEEVRAYLAAFARGRAASFPAYLARAVREAARRARAGRDAPRALEAMLFAVGTDCGTLRLQRVIGAVLPEDYPKPPPCHALTLAGRADLRRHFAVSAALHAASEARAAVAIGELKELLDSRRGGSGFSFDDIMADRAGIHFAATLYAGGPAEWERLAARISRDADILPGIEGLPAGLSAAAFRDLFGSLDTPAYRRMLAAIDARIARETVFGADQTRRGRAARQNAPQR